MPRPHAAQKRTRHVEDDHELEAVVQRQDESSPNEGHAPIPVHEVLPEEVNTSVLKAKEGNAAPPKNIAFPAKVPTSEDKALTCLGQRPNVNR